MLSRLRWKLSLIYLLAAIALMVLIGGSAYRLLTYYFQSSTDLALSYRMTQEIQKLGIQPSAELENASLEWENNHRSSFSNTQSKNQELESESAENPTHETVESVQSFDSELSSIFILPADPQGNLIFNPNLYTPPMQPDQDAVKMALQMGKDWRTVHLADGTRVRLLSYALPGSSNLAVIQAGRSMVDQDRILKQLLSSLLILSGVSAILVWAGSWFLAGRSLRPAQQAWDKQQTFVANASHELRTPLTLLRASAEVAQRGLPAEDLRRTLLEDILNECDHMSRLVDDLLLLSRLDAGNLPLENQPIAIGGLLQNLYKQMSLLAEAQGVTLKMNSTEGVISGDSTRLRQVLLILLNNALHHTPSGGVIRLEAQPVQHWMQISVSDTGSGIAPEHLPHVFERFYRAPSKQRQHDNGSGLGLSIARSLVEAQHGKVTIDSQPGKGTRVTLHFPFRQA
jgi:signal transduction histidine kinase